MMHPAMGSLCCSLQVALMATTLQCPRNAFPIDLALIPPVDLAWFNDVSATALVHPWVLFKIRRKFSPQQQ